VRSELSSRPTTFRPAASATSAYSSGCENVLTLTFVLAGAYTALAVVFAAKGIVRKDDIEKNSLFYLAGTLVNLTYSVLVGLAVSVLVRVL